MADILGFHEVGDDYTQAQVPGGYGAGYTGRDTDAHPLWHCGSVPSMPTMTQAEILDRIREKTAKKTWMTDRCDRVGSRVKNQTSSSYCWIHAPTRGCEVNYVLSGRLLTLSAFFAGAAIKNGRNEGGSGIVGCKFLQQHGTCLESLHPPLPNRGAFTPDRNAEHVANAERHQLTTFEDLNPSDMLAIYTRIVNDVPVTVGIPAWGHEVLLTFLVERNGVIYPGFDNSWGADWGTNGRGVLSGAKMRFDEAGAIYGVEPANG